MALPFLELIAKEALFEVFQTGSLINTVQRDWSNEVADKGASVKVILPETPATQAAGGSFSPAAANPTTRTITLDQWVETVPVKCDLASLAKADRNVLAMYAAPIGAALVSAIEASILTTAGTLATNLGTPTTGTVLPSTIPHFFAYKTAFDSANAPDDGRRYVIAGPELEAAYFGLFGLQTTTGDVAVREQISGAMGTRFGATYVPNKNAFNNTSKLIGYGYHQNAIGLACRPMQPSDLAPQTMATVSYNGIGLTIEAWHDPATSADYIRGQVLYGLSLVSSKGFKIHKTA